MASLTSAAVTVPSFTGLKAAAPARAASPTVSAKPSPMAFSVKAASLKEAAVAAVAVAASAMLASNALAVEVLLGGDDGSLEFVPSVISVSPGDEIAVSSSG